MAHDLRSRQEFVPTISRQIAELSFVDALHAAINSFRDLFVLTLEFVLRLSFLEKVELFRMQTLGNLKFDEVLHTYPQLPFSVFIQVCINLGTCSLILVIECKKMVFPVH
jgi:hypothetical protein